MDLAQVGIDKVIRESRHEKALHNIRDRESGVLNTVNNTACAADDTMARGGVACKHGGSPGLFFYAPI